MLGGLSRRWSRDQGNSWEGAFKDGCRVLQHPLLFESFMYLFVCVCEGMCMTAYVRRSEDNFQELVLSSHHMALKNQTQSIRLSTKYFTC